MKICNLEIDFPEIKGVSQRQIWYATNLRKQYIENHLDDFEHIKFLTDASLDKWSKGNVECYDDEFFEESFEINLTNEERVCLLSTDAKGIIAALKNSDSRFQSCENRDTLISSLNWMKRECRKIRDCSLCDLQDICNDIMQAIDFENEEFLPEMIDFK